jgi:hypothetical protein
MGVVELMLASVTLGLRHGIDWDHVAAMADITGSRAGTKKNRFMLSMWYAIGHESVVCLLGSTILIFAWSIPVWADHLMGKAVGLTLVIMAMVMLLSRRKKGERPHLSRGVALLAKIGRKKNSAEADQAERGGFVFTRKSVFLIGIIHGIGAETPTQLLLFTTLAGIAAKSLGIAAVLVFSFGLLISHALIAVSCIWFYQETKRLRRLFPYSVYAVSFLSFFLGIRYLIE